MKWGIPSSRYVQTYAPFPIPCETYHWASDFSAARSVSRLNSVNVSPNGVVNGFSRKKNGVVFVGLSSYALKRKLPHPSSLSSYSLARADSLNAALSMFSCPSSTTVHNFFALLIDVPLKVLVSDTKFNPPVAGVPCRCNAPVMVSRCYVRPAIGPPAVIFKPCLPCRLALAPPVRAARSAPRERASTPRTVRVSRRRSEARIPGLPRKAAPRGVFRATPPAVRPSSRANRAISAARPDAALSRGPCRTTATTDRHSPRDAATAARVPPRSYAILTACTAFPPGRSRLGGWIPRVESAERPDRLGHAAGLCRLPPIRVPPC